MELKDFRLVMVSAMYENGGNTFHRLLDGHEKLLTYPFESQIGTKQVSDVMSSLFPFKYRWPEFPLNGRPEDDFELFFDEEMKTRLRAPKSSKFRDADIKADEKERKRIFTELVNKHGRTKRNIMAAFFISSFNSWKNLKMSGKEEFCVGYSPIIGVDAERMISDIKDIKILHVIRNPLSAYAETKHRPYPMSLDNYVRVWTFVQYMSGYFSRKYPKNFRIIKFEDLVDKRKKTMVDACDWLGIDFDKCLLKPSWNGSVLDKVYPWGTILTPTRDYNLAKIRELSDEERLEILDFTKPVLKMFDYDLEALQKA